MYLSGQVCQSSTCACDSVSGRPSTRDANGAAAGSASGACRRMDSSAEAGPPPLGAAGRSRASTTNRDSRAARFPP